MIGSPKAIAGTIKAIVVALFTAPKIDIAAKSDPEIELIMKKQVDGVYDHIPFVQNIEMRDYFQEGYAREIYKTCINRYVTEKP